MAPHTGHEHGRVGGALPLASDARRARSGHSRPAGSTPSCTWPITRTYALADVPRALADFGAGAVGKFAVTVQ